MRKLFPLIILCVIVFAKGYSQNDSMSKAVIYFKQKDAIIYLDGKKIKSEKVLRSIPAGKHTIQAWAPTYDLFVDTFYTKKGMNEFYTKKLSHSENYKSYRNRKIFGRTSFLVPGILAVAGSGVYYAIYKNFDKRINTAQKDALILQDTYEKSFAPDEFQVNYDNYYSKKDEYERLQKRQKSAKTQGVIIGSTLAATAITFFIINKLRPNNEYKETPLLARFQPSYDPLNRQLCLTIKLY